MRLAPYAMREEYSQGRRYPEEPHSYRSEYQRDRDRIIHTKAFRRLENKTQVFDPAYSDHFRNRLTHTLEVSQIARTASEALGLNNDLCEVLALSHDIGHPPFSHTGEKVLERIMRKYDSGFDHNLHALRIVEDFEEKYPAFPGLNLTFEVREGIVKHSRDYAAGEAVYVDIREYRLGEQPPLEAQLIDLADEIAYSSADLDDGYQSGFLTLEGILQGVGLFREIYERIRAEYAGIGEKLLVNEGIRRLIDIMTTQLISESRKVMEAKGIDSVDKVRQLPRRLLCFGEEIGRKKQQLKQLLQERLYNHEILRESRWKACHLIEELFAYYLENPAHLPESQYSRLSGQRLHHVVCDYIAGMTDNYVQEKYEQVFHGKIVGR